MNSFEKASTIEAKAVASITPWIEDNFISHTAMTDKKEQYELGDFRAISKSGKEIIIELKAEQKHTGNLFVEIWSNLSDSMKAPGWAVTKKSGLLLYHFADTNVLYAIDLAEFHEYLIVEQAYKCFFQVEQLKYVQANRTVGVLVPVDVLQGALKKKMKKYQL